MRLRLPWQKEPPPAPDLAALARDAGRAAALEVAAATVERLQYQGSLPYGLPDPTGTPPKGLPYHWDNPWKWTVLQAPYKPPDSPATIDTLRQLAAYCDIVRACILHLTREVQAVPIRVVPKDPKDKGEDTKRRCQEALAWLDTRDGGLGGVGSRRSHFEAQSIDDLCIVGAASTFFQRNRRGELMEVIAIDSATIRPRVDIYGWVSGEAAYEQWVYGTLIRGFTREELTYDGVYPLSWTPYFASPVKYLVNVIDTELAADQWNKAWLTDGTGGTEKLTLPEGTTPDQALQWTDYWKAILSGNLKARQRTVWLPGGTTKIDEPTRKDQDFEQFQLWLMRRTCSIFGVQPASIGYTGEQYKVSQDKSMAQTTQFGVSPLLEWRRALYDDVLVRLGYDDLHCQDVSGEEESEAERADRLTKLIQGVFTPNEARAIEGMDAVEGGDELLVPSTLRPLSLALQPPPDPLEVEKAKFGIKSEVKAAGESDSDDDGGSAQEESDARRAEMLGQWERIALKRLSRGQTPDFEFKGLPDELAARVYAGLVNCRDEESVRCVFMAARGDVG